MTEATDKEFKARTVTLVRENGQYILKFPRTEGALIPPMCTDWEKVTGMTLEEGHQVNIKLHIELCGKVRPRKVPVPPAPQPEAVADTLSAAQVHVEPIPAHIQRVADLYQHAMRRLHPRHMEMVSRQFERELRRAVEEADHYHLRESSPDRRYQELRYRDPGANW